jgi:hypothetical protein
MRSARSSQAVRARLIGPTQHVSPTNERTTIHLRPVALAARVRDAGTHTA